MYQGNWTCSVCGGAITELPFEPRSASGLTCRSCYAKQKEKESGNAPHMPVATEAPEIPDDAGLASEPAPAEDIGMETQPAASGRPMFSGDWKCAECGAAITSLPFEPRSTENLKCLDCFKKSKAESLFGSLISAQCCRSGFRYLLTFSAAGLGLETYSFSTRCRYLKNSWQRSANSLPDYLQPRSQSQNQCPT